MFKRIGRQELRCVILGLGIDRRSSLSAIESESLAE